jgi:ATP-dependent protease HslVU (ClpYQ) ATPase subunit
MEGSPVHTPTYGIIDTRNILVVAAGVFNMHDPSDLLPELQSRLPIRVQLKPFTEDQYKQIVPGLLEQQVRHGRACPLFRIVRYSGALCIVLLLL